MLRAYLPAVILGVFAAFTPQKLAFLPDVAGRPGDQWWPQYAVPDWIHFFVPLLAICYVVTVAIVRTSINLARDVEPETLPEHSNKSAKTET